MAVHRKRDPIEKFNNNITEDDLDNIYPIELAEPMTEHMAEAWKDKQLGSNIAALKAMPIIHDDAEDVWIDENLKRKWNKTREMQRREEHKNTKVFANVRLERAQKVAAQSKGKHAHFRSIHNNPQTMPCSPIQGVRHGQRQGDGNHQ